MMPQAAYFVSFYPAVAAEENLPFLVDLSEPEVMSLLQRAAGVVLPPYVPPWRYRAITGLACCWFPRLEVRFNYPGKARQILLFRELGVRHPESLLFQNPLELLEVFSRCGSPWGYPLVLKGDLGGGGSTVYPIYQASDVACYAPGLPQHQPALLQRWVEHGGRDLRVVIYGEVAISYFRVGGGRFYNNVCRGGRIDHTLAPDQQRHGVGAVQAFCRRTGTDLAAFDLMFPDQGAPVFVEINQHFGRKGLGGRRGHEEYFQQAVGIWRERCLAGP